MRVVMAVTTNIRLANKTAILSLAALDLHHFLFILLHGAIPRGTNACCDTTCLCSRLTTHTCSPPAVARPFPDTQLGAETPNTTTTR